MKKQFLCATFLFGLLFSCGENKTGNETPADTAKTVSPDTALKADTTTPTAQDTVKPQTQEIKPEPGTEKIKGIIIATVTNGEARASIPLEALKIQAFQNHLDDNVRITGGWIEKAPGGRYYLMGSAKGANNEVQTIAKHLVKSGSNLILPEKNQKVEKCSSKGCTSCKMEWKADGSFSKCGCPGDSRQMCSHQSLAN